MKLSLKQKQRVIRCLVVLVFALYGIDVVDAMFNNRPCFRNPYLLWVEAAVFVAMVFLTFKWWRCPKCGKQLGRSIKTYCPHCGEKIDYDAT